MKKGKRLAVLLAASVLLFGAAACSRSDGRIRPDDGKPIGYQLDKPQKGEEIAVLTTSMGEIRLRLFPDAAPKAVENFKGLIQKGYYNGLTFHRVIKDFMIQGGDPNGDGTGGESLWNKAFPDEFNKNLLNIRGAVSMANSGKDTNGSQFFINQAGSSVFPGWEDYEQAYAAYKQAPKQYEKMQGFNCLDMSQVTEAYKKLYEENGGNPNLDGAYSVVETGHTVFAQVFEGMDTVDKIAAVDVNEKDKPVTPVTVEKAEIKTYQG